VERTVSSQGREQIFLDAAGLGGSHHTHDFPHECVMGGRRTVSKDRVKKSVLIRPPCSDSRLKFQRRTSLTSRELSQKRKTDWGRSGPTCPVFRWQAGGRWPPVFLEATEIHAGIHAAICWPRNSLALLTSASHFFNCSGFRKFTSRWRS